MNQNEQNNIKNYFINTLEFTSYNDFREFPINALVFSYLVGMHPKDCREMCLEEGTDSSEIREYEEIEDYIYSIMRDLAKNL